MIRREYWAVSHVWRKVFYFWTAIGDLAAVRSINAMGYVSHITLGHRRDSLGHLSGLIRKSLMPAIGCGVGHSKVSRVGRSQKAKAKEAITFFGFLLIMVGARGFEPPTSRSRTVRSTRLSHAPSN